MSEPKRANQYPLEEAAQPLDEEGQVSVSLSSLSEHGRINSDNYSTHFPVQPTSHIRTANQLQQTDAAREEARQDLAQIIGRARTEIKRLRQELARLETHAAALTQERDEIQQRYNDLYDTFLETVHVAAEEEIRQAARELQATPERVPNLLAPIYAALTHWHETQQAEREHILAQKLAAIEKLAEALREELQQERQALTTEQEKLIQQRQALHDQHKLREANIRNRWFAKTWITTTLMFLVLPALQIYLLTQKASPLNIIIIPTTLCLAVIGLISFVRARKKPVSKPPAK
jgi:DNA repair exonuclease SbcCD ATPase subunit